MSVPDAERNRPEKWNLATVVLMLIGLASLATSAWLAYDTATFLSRATHTMGVVSDAKPHPRIRFTTTDRKTVVEFVQNGFVSRPRGAEVPVAYAANDPLGTARVETFWANWGMPLWLLPMGLGFGLLPLVGARARLRA